MIGIFSSAPLETDGNAIPAAPTAASFNISLRRTLNSFSLDGIINRRCAFTLQTVPLILKQQSQSTLIFAPPGPFDRIISTQFAHMAPVRVI